MARHPAALLLTTALWLPAALAAQEERPVLRVVPAQRAQEPAPGPVLHVVPVERAQEPAPAAPRTVGQTKDRQEAVQQAMNKMATVSAERQGALYLRDLGKHCGVAQPELDRLGKALNETIAHWVETHPPQVYGNYEADFRTILKQPSWTKAFQEICTAEQQAAWQQLDGARQRRLAAATAVFVRATAACKLRLTPEQIKALEPLCQRIGEQSLELQVRARPEQMVRELDRTSTHILSDLQSQYPELMQTRRSGKRDQSLEFDLECERIRLLCQLDEERAHLLRACGRARGHQLAADQAEKDKELAKERAKAAKEGNTPPPRPSANVDLPDEECLRDAFWQKVRDSVLNAGEKAQLAQNAAVDKAAVIAARVELVLASLDALFHLDPEQMKTLEPLAQKVVEQDLTTYRATSLEVTRSFGMQVGRSDSSPEERGAMKALEDILDRQQFEVLRDKVGI